MKRFMAFGVVLASAACVRAHDSVVPHSHSVDPQTSDLFFLSLAALAALGAGFYLIGLAQRRRRDGRARVPVRRR